MSTESLPQISQITADSGKESLSENLRKSAKSADEILTLGFGMQGMGPLVEPYLEQVCRLFYDVTYLEIGVGHGETLTAVADYLNHSVTGQWRAIGVELPDGYSYSRHAVEANASKKRLPCVFQDSFTDPVDPAWEHITVYLQDSHSFLASYWREEIHFALIDGCHGKPCVLMDFLCLEAHIQPGGIVMMHDFGEDQLGQKQPHCENGINVRGAAQALKLMNGERPGWEFVTELVGDKQAGSANMGVFRKC